MRNSFIVEGFVDSLELIDNDNAKISIKNKDCYGMEYRMTFHFRLDFTEQLKEATSVSLNDRVFIKGEIVTENSLLVTSISVLEKWCY